MVFPWRTWSHRYQTLQQLWEERKVEWKLGSEKQLLTCSIFMVTPVTMFTTPSRNFAHILTPTSSNYWMTSTKISSLAQISSNYCRKLATYWGCGFMFRKRGLDTDGCRSSMCWRRVLECGSHFSWCTTRRFQMSTNVKPYQCMLPRRSRGYRHNVSVKRWQKRGKRGKKGL